MNWRTVLPPLLLLLSSGQSVSAQVRGDQSICDFYAAKNYGENNSTTQLKLMQGIVAYAYAGGNSMPNGDKDSTGIFNPGQFKGEDVYLRPWFDGTKATSNNNDQAVSIGWLDGGGTAPLVAFINGSSPTAKIKPGTNQYKLFTHWYYVFGKAYSCSRYKDFLEPSFQPLNPAYVHKYMDLNSTHVGYFIDQLLVASKYYGFSDSDITALSTSMNGKYNVRCLPPGSDNSLSSICLNEECPVAAPSPDCAAYENVKPRGVGEASQSGSPSSSSSSTNSSIAPGGSSPSGLSAGAIAGIAIGGAVALLIAVGMVLFFCRRSRKKTTPPVASAAAPAASPIPPMSTPMSTPPPAGYPPPQYGYAHNPHESYQQHARHPTDSYISYGAGSPTPAWVEPKTRPEELGASTPITVSAMTSPAMTAGSPPSHVPRPFSPEMTQLAEMEAHEAPAGWHSTNNPTTTTT